MGYQKKEKETVDVHVVLPNDHACRLANALKAYKSTQGIKSQEKAILKIILENKQIKEELRRIWVIELAELNKRRDKAKADAGLIRADKILAGR